MSTGINVVDEFNVDNTGLSDTTDKIQNALTGTAAGDTLWFPTGTYLVTPDVLSISNRSLIGSSAGLGMSPTFKAAAAGTYLVQLHGNADSDGFTYDCNNVCATGLYANAVSGTIATQLALNATDFGMIWKEGGALSILCSVRSSQKGHQLIAPSGSMFEQPSASDIQGLGFEWIGGAATAPPSSQSGVCLIEDLNLKTCGIAGGAQMHIRGAEGGILSFATIEWATDGDGILMDEDTHNTTVENGWFKNAGAVSKPIHLGGPVQACTFINNALGPLGIGPVIYCDDPSNHWNNTYIGNAQQSRTAPTPAILRLFDGFTTYDMMPMAGELTAPTVPTLGKWDVGQRVWRSTGASGPMGWFCSVAGVPGTWVAFG